MVHGSARKTLQDHLRWCLSKQIGCEYEWGVTSEGKHFCKITMNKKVEATVDYFENYIGKKAKTYRTPGIPHEKLDKHIGEPTDIDEYNSLVGKAMFFTTNTSIKTGAAVQLLSALCPILNQHIGSTCHV